MHATVAWVGAAPWLVSLLGACHGYWHSGMLHCVGGVVLGAAVQLPVGELDMGCLLPASVLRWGGCVQGWMGVQV